MSKTFQLLGAVFAIDDERPRDLKRLEVATKLDEFCSGNACGDIDMRWEDETNSYHFFNDGEKKVRVEVQQATYAGCTPQVRNRDMRPGDEWDCGYFGVCKYEANYR